MSWSDAENARFEMALKIYGPGRLDLVAAAVGGGKTVEDMRQHFQMLELDIGDFEAGNHHLVQQRHAAADAAAAATNNNNANGTANNNRRRDDRRSNGGGEEGSNNNNRGSNRYAYR